MSEVAMDAGEVPTSAGHRLRIEQAAEQIAAHVRVTGGPAIFAGDGRYLGSLADRDLAAMVLNDDRMRRGPNVDGSDTLLLVDPDEQVDGIRERLYRSRRWASPGAVARHEVAETLYAVTGVGAFEEDREGVERVQGLPARMVELRASQLPSTRGCRRARASCGHEGQSGGQ